MERTRPVKDRKTMTMMELLQENIERTNLIAISFAHALVGIPKLLVNALFYRDFCAFFVNSDSRIDWCFAIAGLTFLQVEHHPKCARCVFHNAFFVWSLPCIDHFTSLHHVSISHNSGDLKYRTTLEVTG